MSKVKKLIFHISAAVILAAVLSPAASAFPADTYASSSRLASGNWVKIAVSASGMHHISAETLRSWGFANPQSIRIYGYGGARISDNLILENYRDDLPVTSAVADARGITFYAQGPVLWTGPDAAGRFDFTANPWTLRGYYFLSDSGETESVIAYEGMESAGLTPATTFTATLMHETDLVSPGEVGHQLVGEDFRYTPERNFSFNLPGRVEGSDVWLKSRFFTKTKSAGSTFTLSVNGTTLPSVRVPVTTGDAYGDTCTATHTFALSGERIALNVRFRAAGTVTLANLDNFTVNYTRRLEMPAEGVLEFASDARALKLAGATDATRVWDVTDPVNVIEMKTASASGTVTWAPERSGLRRYVAWNANARMSAPTLEGRVSAQNIHGEAVPDMVIVTCNSWRRQAERIAQLHRNSPDSMRVLVVTPETVYNEFGSGSPDINAVRRMLKMFYDRGSQDGHRLQYAMMVGRPTFDNRRLTDVMKNVTYETLPAWQSDPGHNDSFSYSTDDILTMLEDGSGIAQARDRQCIAVGRLTPTSEEEARGYVDKLVNYVNRPLSGDWKNKLVVLADDQDSGEHLAQAEKLVSQIERTASGRFMFNKVYIDAYEKINGVTQGARDRMYKGLNEGAAWWAYIGHASLDAWTAEGMLTRHDIANNLYFRRLPMLYAATCSFSRWEGSLVSGAEMMINNPSGGVIASICPTRPVYISSNGVFTGFIGEAMATRDASGRYMSAAEIMRQAKNRSTDSNKLRYVVLGDPALRMPTPAGRVVIESIDGKEADSENPAEVKARQRFTIKGHITAHDGSPLDNFNGSLWLTIYDAEESITTLGRGTEKDPGRQDVFEQQGTRLYAGRDSISGGRFEIKVAMPSEIADNYRPAAINLYAIANDGNEASDTFRDIYVYGYDDTAENDDNPPVIDALYLNHQSFNNGDIVNESPMLFADVSDDIGINLSQAGIGHTLMMKLDGATSYTDISDYFTPAADGSPSGSVAYPIDNLQPGNHTIDFRVWDTAGNHSTASLEFFVQPGLAPTIFEIFTDTNPATTEANFYVRHNRPDATLDVTFTVYDMMGRAIWSHNSQGRSDMFLSSPVTWDLTDGAGRRVPRGIYIYKADVSTDGDNAASASRRIAVAAR